MSGIAGIIYFDGRPVEPGQVEAMTAAMHYRGPDGIHHWCKGNVAMGQCLLHTTPESLEENLPLTNEDQSLVLVMDGRVDNFQELRRELLHMGVVLRTRADAELVLRAYEVWGETCPDHIIGECVFFIWDARRHCLFTARDAAGTRHFYYHEGKGWFAFASEIKGLLALSVIERRLNESRFLDFLVEKYDRDDEVGTCFQGILRLPAGHCMEVTARGLRIWRYWNPANLSEQRFASMDECTEAFMDQLRVAVKCRMRSVQPLGAMLSGGLDSSTIVALISSEFRGELREPLRTYSLVQEDRANCPDGPYIDAILWADSWLKPLILTSVVGGELAASIDQAIAAADEPFTVSAGLPYLLSYRAAAKAGSRAVFDGMAGDQMFYGFSMSMSALFRGRRMTPMVGLLAAYHRHGWLRSGVKDLVRASLSEMAPDRLTRAWRQWRGERQLGHGDLALLQRPVARALVESRRAAANARAEARLEDTDQAVHARFFTTGLLSFAHERNSILAAPFGVEPRCPFSDRRVMEFAVRMPLAAKLSMPWYKYLLRQGTAGLLPEPVRWRRQIGRQPGWTFYDHLTRSLAEAGTAGWAAEPCVGALAAWVNVEAATELWARCAASGDFGSRQKAFTLFIAARWLATQGWAPATE
jgi:asparagine synthase (glutamine-hydrolysing)